jgi:hypothetical protein
MRPCEMQSDQGNVTGKRMNGDVNRFPQWVPLAPVPAARETASSGKVRAGHRALRLCVSVLESLVLAS